VTARPLTTRKLRAAAVELAAADPALGASLTRWGPPPLWARDPSFATLIHFILEQQVSLASAQAAFDRLEVALADEASPDTLLALDDPTMLAIGFSRQKRDYARGLATAMLDGFDLASLTQLADDDVRTTLTAIRGIGPWTADIYLTMCLLRPDVWPRGDLALATSARDVYGLAAGPTTPELAAMAERWRPYRAVAARMLWHDYLRRRDLPL
jgi:DNA-3-methyladenine glycosylase II